MPIECLKGNISVAVGWNEAQPTVAEMQPTQSDKTALICVMAGAVLSDCVTCPDITVGLRFASTYGYGNVVFQTMN